MASFCHSYKPVAEFLQSCCNKMSRYICISDFQVLNLTSLLFTYFSRTALAALHFNENLRRESQQSKDGEVYTKVCYPKYKLGDEIVREVKKPPTYGNDRSLNSQGMQ